MIISNLRLVSLGHCFVHLPKLFPERINIGAIITIRSVKDDNKLLKLIWNGAQTDNDETIIDISFAAINGFQQEPVVLDTSEIKSRVCTSCQVQLLDPNEIDIITEHFSTNLLDRCRLVYKDLSLPIWVSEHVKVNVKVIHVEPIGGPVELNQWTEMQIEDVPGRTTQIPITSEIFSPTSCPIRVNLLITGSRGSGKTHHLKILAKKCDISIINCKQLRGKRVETIKKIFENPSSILFLDDIDSLVGIEEKSLYHERLVDWFCGLFKRFERSVTNFQSIISTCHSLDRLDSRISRSRGRKYFTYISHIDELNMSDRSNLLKHFIDKQRANVTLKEEDFNHISRLCKTFSPRDLGQLVERAMISVCSRSLTSFDTEPISLDLLDFQNAMSGYVPINMRNVELKPKSSRTFDQIGGMKSIKAELLKLILMPLKYPKLYARSPIKPQTSVLLYGPPGCGKTLIADALTNQADINSICIRGPELLSKYIGSSEAAVRELFHRAQVARPCIIFFDEFESLVARRGSDSTGVTDRVVNQFLTLMDGFEELSHDVFVVAATSRPDMIDPAILRPGRIDKHLYCDYPNYEERLEILSVMTNHMTIKDFNLFKETLAAELEYFTGADIQFVLYSAQIKALHDAISRRNKYNAASDESLSEPPTTTSTRLDKEAREMNLKIIVEKKHLDETLLEISSSSRDNIEAKYRVAINRHPRNFDNLNNAVVSSRATLM